MLWPILEQIHDLQGSLVQSGNVSDYESLTSDRFSAALWQSSVVANWSYLTRAEPGSCNDTDLVTIHGLD